MTLFEELQWRNLIHSYTDEGVIALINSGKATFYLGADPTGDSLHVGHLLVYIFAKRLEKNNNKAIFLIGGSTSSIGDPKPGAERPLLPFETIDYNSGKLTEQVNNLFNCEIVNNYDWTKNIDVLTFLRTYGKYFNVNYMINKETVKARLDTGISYTEFSYQILQALDFEYLFRVKKCNLQIGGQDQWGNITGGLELIRKMNGSESTVYGLTVPLVTKSDGTKFGKTEGNSVWLDPAKTSPYAFYQYWINTPDNEVIMRLKQFTFLDKEAIEALEVCVATNPHLREAQKALAESVTTLVHGEKACQQAIRITQSLFSGDVKQLTKEEIDMGFGAFEVVSLAESINIIDLLVLCKAAVSKREAREFINNNAVLINGDVITDFDYVITKANALEQTFTIIRRGKKNYYLIRHQ